MDGESIFYVIVAVVYFAVSIMNSRKKAKQKKQGKGQPRQVDPNQQPQQETAPKEPTLEDLLGEMFGKEVQPVQTAPPRQEFEPISNKEFLRQQELAEQARKAEERALERQKNMIAHRKKMLETVAREKSDSKKIERKKGKLYGNVGLKEAIIAQTILERPYK